MAITLDTASFVGTGAVTGFSFDHVVSEPNTVVFVGLHSNNSISAAATGTYNNVSMNKIDNTLGNLKVWMYVNPPTGTNTIRFWVQTFTRTCQAGAVGYKGVDLITPLQTGTWFAAQYSAVAGSFLTTGTMAVDGKFLEFAGGYDNVTAWQTASSAGQVEIGRVAPPGGGRWQLVFVSTDGGAGTYVQSWWVSGTTVDFVRHWGRGLNPAASAPVTSYGVQFRSYILGLG